MVVPQIGQVETSAGPQFTQIGRVASNANHFGNPIDRMATNADHFASQLGRMGSNGNHFGGRDASAANNRLSNSIAGSCQPAFQDVNIAWARMLGVNNAAPAAAPYTTWKSTMNMATCPATQNLQSQVNRRQGSLSESLLSNQSHGWTTDIYRSHDSSSLQSKNELPIPQHPWCDLNTPPIMENDANSCTSSSQLAANSTHGAALENIPAPMATNTSRPSSTGEGTQFNLLLHTENESCQNRCDGLLQNILSSLSSIAAPPPSEQPKVTESLERGKGNDLDQTPPKKPPKRMRHRAKVIKENKQQRDKKVATAKSSSSEEMQTGKRKYVHKSMKESAVEDAETPTEKRKYVQKNFEASAAQQNDPFEGTSNPNSEFPGKSCRRGLDYDMEPAKIQKQGTVKAPNIQIMNNKRINLNADFITTKASLGAKSMDRTNMESQVSQLRELLHGIHHPPVLAQGVHEEVSGPTTDYGISMTKGLLRHTNLQSLPRMSSHPIEGQSSKRKNHQIDITCGNNSNFEGSVSEHRDDCWQFKRHTSTTCSENRYKLLTEAYSGENAMSSHAKAAKVSTSSSPKAANAISYALQSNTYVNNTYVNRDAVNHWQNDRISKTSYDRLVFAANTFPESHIAPEAYNSTKRTGKCNRISGLPSFAYSARTKDIFQPNPEARARHRDQMLSRASHAESALNQKENINNVEKQKGLPQAPQEQFTSQEDGDEQAVDSAVEAAIMSQMANLHLSNRTSEENKEQNALVLYKGDGTIVLYEGSDLVKKRKPRPKVDLDIETERVWKLLMEKGESDDPGNMDKEKEKRWEEERRIFHGRVESFIAKMHLVQGDRRFSKWKGSVVDSVIGVFLTQNVSDHLSSSAFMSLAARFPPKSTKNNTSGRESACIMFKQPDISKETRETIKWIEELLSSSHSDQSNLTLNEPTLFFENYETSWIENSSVAGVYGQNQEEEVLSSQGSSDSIIVQAAGGVGSYSGSNSEAEELASGCNHNMSLDFSTSDNLHLKNINLFEEHHCGSIGNLVLHKQSWNENQQEILMDKMQMSKMKKCNRHEDSCTFPRPTFGIFSEMQRSVFPSSNDGWHAIAESEILQEGLGSYAEESMSSFPFHSFISRKEKDTTNASRGFGQTSKMMNNIAAHQWQRPSDETIQVASTNCLLNEPRQYKQTNLHRPYKSQIVAEEETSHPETAFSNNPTNLARASAARPNQRSQNKNISNSKGNTVDIEDEVLVSHKKLETGNKLQQQTPELYSTGRVPVSASKEPLKAKKGKASGGEKDAVDWDSLRKEAKATNGIRERSTETMDSLDYESLRSASVSEVSETIKERGMNNMLAARIKEFLDRLVQEHGGIDLEWLRDVPPEKAKDYLLSVRGLGLKSVECVRLLTLHHLAFPVDTNVGRIAVRLGWVPIQPLPESLQLHLLELYPVLETVQKYLWPRLCKLDQRTLYELHYQLITFGKVFCTKSRPNCNACPMRAECRHFASAFASARLALPGPEEKSLTTSISLLNNMRNPGMVINHMSLMQAVDHLSKRAESCIPIIEEPATPEQEEYQVIESDIEDAVYEDSDEIPSINLNMEELTENVQNFMQGGDMSKALVVIHSNAASIPMPKLKNVSRLRTEHQVYELPDSHPLLEGMDRRETDDPSPYLFAIWSPGETSETIQQPGKECECHEPGKFCNNRACFSCNSIREANSETVRGTLLIPCRTAMKGSFPLNGTYFQVNEVFADHRSSMDPITVPRAWIWNLPRRMVYFGSSCTSIFKGLSTGEIQQCFWKGFVCVRGFEQETRVPRPLVARLHFPASKLAKEKNDKR